MTRRVRSVMLIGAALAGLLSGVASAQDKPADQMDLLREKARADFALMCELGINVIRIYHVPPRWLLDVAAEFGLRVIISIPWTQHVEFLNERQLKRKIGGALRSWQRNATAFLARFDADRDGKVAGAEMAAAREAAGHEVLKQYSLQGGVHTLGLSPDGRPFILISADQGRIRRRYRRLTAVHLFIFFASLGALVYGLA